MHFSGYLGNTPICESIEDMCNEIAREVTLSSVKTIMETLELSAEQAMDALKMTKDERAEIRERLFRIFG